MKIGDFVRYIVPDDRRSEAFAVGRIMAREEYADFHGKRIWWYVQWFDHDGKPDNDFTKHASQELMERVVRT